MTVGLIGLGRMGQAIAARVVHAGISVVGYDKFLQGDIDLSRDKKHTDESKHQLFQRVDTLAEVAEKTRIIWLMVPQGKPVDDVLHDLVGNLRAGDIIIDGGNSFYQDTVRRMGDLKKYKVHYLDCGTSGGLHGREIGFSLMVGGDHETFKECLPLFEAVAAPKGYRLLGPSGAGHYVKMVHNGIEYGLLEAYAEGFHVLKDGSYKNLDLEAISDVWNHGSIVRSWILELADAIFKCDQDFTTIDGAIGENLTGLWTFEEAERHTIPIPVIKAALQVRAESRQTGGNYATKIVSLLRHEFGGHPVTYLRDKKKKEHT